MKGDRNMAKLDRPMKFSVTVEGKSPRAAQLWSYWHQVLLRSGFQVSHFLFAQRLGPARGLGL